jgi:AAA+ superfamily predicted ATPase
VQTVEQVLSLAQPGSIVLLAGGWGSGRSTVLHALHQRLGGRLLTARDVLRPQVSNHPFKFEEVFFQLLNEVLEQHETVLVDDFDSVVWFTSSHGAPRSQLLHLILRALAAQVEETGRRLILVVDPDNCYSLASRSHDVALLPLTRKDQEFLFRARLSPAQAARLDFDAIYAFAPKLTCRQIALTGQALRPWEALTTTALIDHLSRFNLESNVDLAQVEEVTFADLKGLDTVVQALRMHLLLPLQNVPMARELELRPKRGVLLYGPPGTGKTSIGRALAHELGSKFFLLDGEASDRECHFGQYVYYLFQAAEKNAPSVVFIDDSDVLFKHAADDDSRALYRHLLSQLDGVHSKGKGDVCVMLTAMEVSDLPPALVRSGRIELWLEVAAPDESAREEILRHRCERLLERFSDLDLKRIVAATKEFTGADLRRLVEDAKNQIAYRLLNDGAELDVTEEFLQAAKSLARSKDRYRHGASEARVSFRNGEES